MSYICISNVRFNRNYRHWSDYHRVKSSPLSSLAVIYRKSEELTVTAIDSTHKIPFFSLKQLSIGPNSKKTHLNPKIYDSRLKK